jgi:hypothetical protein
MKVKKEPTRCRKVEVYIGVVVGDEGPKARLRLHCSH